MTKSSTTPKRSSQSLRRFSRVRGVLLALLAVVLLVIGALAIWFMTAIMPNVPAIDAVTDYRPKIPLRIYTADKVLIGQFGVEHRDFVPIAKIPPLMKSAVLAIEDARFYEHGGIDLRRALGAARANLGGGFRQGASTITMQVARNFFLTKEKLVSRKLTEVALAYKIENALSKDQILELYMNQIYLGQRSYGFSSAARSYFGKTLDQLTLAETAMLAGLPQNPARHNPVANPKRAQARQHAILKRLLTLGQIDQAQYDAALAEPLRVKRDAGQSFDTRAEYVAELARQVVFDQYGEEAYTRGIVVTTTILKAEQDAAYDSVRRNVLAYDSRHGYRGPEARIELPAAGDARDAAIIEALQKRRASDGLLPAVVIAASAEKVQVETLSGDAIGITGAGLKFAAAGLSSKAREALRITPGAIVRITKGAKDSWSIVQVPQVAAAFVAIDADTGAYHALVGGFDYNLQKFNHVTQAWRQPGSSIKPFVYSAALEKGYSPATRILDAPLELPGASVDAPWRPQNDDGQFDGEVTLRQSLAKSKNVPTVRVLRAVSVDFAHQYLEHFGFDLARHPRNYTMALGTGAVTPLQLAGAYAVFANGGYRVKPWLIARIEDGNGSVIMENQPPPVKAEEARVITARNAFVMDTMLRDVTRYGTAAASAKQLNRQDLAGKTGTTSDAFDGWFAGYAGNVVGVAWMGYDEPRSLGGREFGATLAMPIWVDYMRVALAKVAPVERVAPEDVVNQDGDWIYPEFVDALAERSIDIEAPLEQDGLAPGDPDALPATEDGAPLGGALPLPSVAPPPDAPAAPLAPPPPPPQPPPPVPRSELF